MDKELFRRAAIIRHFEERLLGLFSEGRLSGTVHTCIGQELCALAVVDNLQEGDWVFSNHRCHGHYLAWSDDLHGLLAEIMGMPTGICAGRGGSQHIFRDQFLSNGVQGGGVPIAAGCALALGRMEGSQSIVTAFIGDGTLGGGVVYETLNLAGKLKVPLLLVLEQNGYAQSTNTTTTISGSIRGRFEAFGWRYWESSIWQEDELFARGREAVEHVRRNRAPAALCINCYRLKAHSKGDDNRDPREIAAYEERDPLRRFEREQPEAAGQVHSECKALIQSVLASLEAAPKEGGAGGERSAADFRTPSVTGAPLLTGKAGREPGTVRWSALSAPPTPQRVVERLRAGLRQLLAQDGKVVLLGEDLEDPYGGAFKVTKGLSTEFPGRVMNTPISEAAVVGFGNGLAVAGLHPIVEIMFGDFITLAADQLINQASKFAYMYNGQVEVPVIIRTPMGGRRGYGATHSQSLEKVFFGTPGLSVVAVNSALDPALLLERVHDLLNGPCLFVENKLLYTTLLHHLALDGRPWLENGASFPTLKLEAPGQGDITVVAYGGMLAEVEAAVRQAFFEEEISTEVLAPTMVYPLDIAPIVESVGKTRRLLIVEEGQGFAGFGAEVIALCAEHLPGPPLAAARVYAAPHPIPCSKELEKQALPDSIDIMKAMRDLVKR